MSKLLARSGCLVAVLTPLIAFVLFPRANWLFAVPLIIVALFLIVGSSRKELSSTEVADLAEQLLNGLGGEYDVDDYEHLRPRDPRVRDLWTQSLNIGPPEEWYGASREQREKLRGLISALREIDKAHRSGK